MSDTHPVVPGYEVLELLGFGGSGEVWLARDRKGARLVALKRLHPRASLPAERAGAVDRLLHEAAVLRGVRHPHLVELLDVVALPDEVVLVLAHAEGGSLSALLRRRRRLGPGEVVTLGTPLAEALAAVHARGVLHGDVSPANVLLDGSGRPLLADLGVARLAGQPGGEAEATLDYADPAVVRGADPKPAADVYGLGAVCYTALAGVAPFAGGGPGALARHVPSAPTALVAAIVAALAADPADRPSPAALASALYAACPPEPLLLARPAPAAVVGTPAGERPAVAALADEPATRRAGQAEPVCPPAAVADDGPQTRRVHRAVVEAVPSDSGRRGRPRRAAVAATVALCAAVSVAAVVQGSRGGHAGVRPPAVGTATGAGTSVPPGPASPGWTAVVTALQAARSSAFAAADPGPLARVDAPGGQALRQDRAWVAALAARHVVARGFAVRVRSVAVQAVAPTSVVLDVEVSVPAYSYVGADRRAVENRPGAAAARWHLTLVPDGHDGWLLASLLAG